MINLLNEESIFLPLSNLKADTKAVFGKMSPQHMVEHLEYVVKFSNGTMPQSLMVPEERAASIKRVTIYSNHEMSIGFKAPMLGDEPPAYVHENLNKAIESLKNELEGFHSYFKHHPDAKPVSPVLNELDYKEWIVFHNKHFTHHFKQFSLLLFEQIILYL